eukprot:COSAG01_NODE_1257_length_11020_cov_5.619723_5_plen_82_part_00
MLLEPVRHVIAWRRTQIACLVSGGAVACICARLAALAPLADRLLRLWVLWGVAGAAGTLAYLLAGCCCWLYACAQRLRVDG